MLSFLRKTRKTLFNSSKTQQYGLYALGEILLVMVGILLALQVNNWSEKLKERQVEKMALENLHKDITTSLEQLEFKSYTAAFLYERDSIILECIRQKKLLHGADTLYYYLDINSFPPTFDPDDGVIREMLNTGKLGLIKNEELRKFVSEWDKYIQEVKEIEGWAITFRREYEERYYISRMPYQMNFESENNLVQLENLFAVLFNDIEFENIRVRSESIFHFLFRRYKKLENKLKTMLELIEKELDK